MEPASRSVSVIVPAYNSAPTLPRAVRSALARDLPDIEMLVVDDASTDRTASVAAELAAEDSRVRVITLPQNRGKPFAMNVAIDQSCGRWIAVLDADDWYAPGRLSTLVETAERHDADLIADNQFLYDDGAARVVGTAFPAGDGGRLLDKTAFIAGSDPYSNFDFGMLKPVIRAAFVRSSGLRYREEARLSEDFLYMLEFMAAGGRAWLLDRPMYYWSQAFGTISRRWTETGAGRWRYDFLSAARANEEVLQTMRSAGEDRLADLLHRRARAFRRLHRMQQLTRMRAEGAAPGRVALQILGHPSIWPLVAQRGARRVVKLLPQRSPVRA